MKLKDFLDSNNFCYSDFAKQMSSPTLSRQNLNHRLKYEWECELKKGGIVMRTADGKKSVYHDWDQSCLKK